jgi:uncharacterized phage protein (TIGR01671 family)
MREIKYRAWDKYASKLRLVKSISYADDGFAKTVLVRLVDGVSHGYVNGESCELMQYTGLKDKNGKEVYEGDIVSWHGVSDAFVIEWVNLDASFAAADKSTGKTHYDYIMTSLNEAEVLGNIYENPKLLAVMDS